MKDQTDFEPDEYWVCIIGPTKRRNLPDGADFPMRVAVEGAFIYVCGHPYLNCWSGWGVDSDTVQAINKTWSVAQKEGTAMVQGSEARPI